MQNRPKLIGVTGGIGSGKSTVCMIFEVLGNKIYYADDRAKWLMENDPGLIKEIKVLFGNKAYHQKKLDRKFIADKAFQNKSLLKKLNNKVHPAVRLDLIKWVKENETEHILFDEAALLFETGSYKKMDHIILVTAPQDIRIKRVLTRDPHRTEKSIKEIIEKQMSDEDKRLKADFIINNNDVDSVIRQTMEIYRKLTYSSQRMRSNSSGR